MLSGVSPADHLSELNISVVANLSGVGSHLRDHLVVELHFKDKSNTGLYFFRAPGFASKLNLDQSTSTIQHRRQRSEERHE